MDENLEISEKERERRRKISEYRKKVIEKKRKKGLAEYNKRRKKEKERKLKEKEREKEKKKKEKEALKHKRPVGRPKKRGPKKKRVRKKKNPKKLGRKQLDPILYKIISCKNGIQNKLIGKYRTIEDAYDVFNSLRDSDNNVLFPMSISGTRVLKNSIDEYILIEKNGKVSAELRNEYGKLVEHTTNKKGWSIIDKFRYKKEEQFWVFGYENRNERKTARWIYENMVYGAETPFKLINFIMTYKNKLVIKYDGGDIGLVICKSMEDSITLYNIIEKLSKKDKLKCFVFIGDFSKISKSRKKLEDELIELTGWTKKKIQMSHTTYYAKQKKGG